MGGLEVFVDSPSKAGESKFASLRKKKESGGEEEIVESQILGLCSFRSVVDFKEASGPMKRAQTFQDKHTALSGTHTG